MRGFASIDEFRLFQVSVIAATALESSKLISHSRSCRSVFNFQQDGDDCRSTGRRAIHDMESTQIFKKRRTGHRGDRRKRADSDEEAEGATRVLKAQRTRPRIRVAELDGTPAGSRDVQDARAGDKFELRFAAQTGLVTAQVDKHMWDHPIISSLYLASKYRINNRTAYIDAGMAKEVPGYEEAQEVAAAAPKMLPTHVERSPPRLPASFDKVHEVDLGPNAMTRNVARTKAHFSGKSGKDDARRGKKTRTDVKQRTEADIARDRLVEDLLHEAKLDIYETVDHREGQNRTLENALARMKKDEENDEALADQFRRDFFDSIIESRVQSGRGATSTGVLGADGKPKGPKPGGSRNDRLAREEYGKAPRAH